MNAFRILAAACLLASPLLADHAAVEASKAHLSATLQGDAEKLADTYAARVVLMPGHEFLKPEYGLASEAGRGKATKVERTDLIQAITKASKARPAPPADKIDALMKSLRFEVLETSAGDYAVPPSDPVGTPDSKLHFAIEKDDVLIKAGPPKGDFLLFQMRRIDGKWRVVAEYLD